MQKAACMVHTVKDIANSYAQVKCKNQSLHKKHDKICKYYKFKVIMQQFLRLFISEVLLQLQNCFFEIVNSLMYYRNVNLRISSIHLSTGFS